MNKRGQSNFFESLRNFLNEEKDTPLGLLIFMSIGLAITRYLIISTFEPLKNYSQFIMPLVGFIVFVLWLKIRATPLDKNKFNIAISQFDILVLDANQITTEQKRALRKELIDYVYSSLHFNKEHLELDKYLEIVQLPPRLEINQKNAKETCKRLNLDLLIWGDAYFKEDNLYIKPRFEFLREPSNIYYAKFKQNLNNLRTFKLKLENNLIGKKSELSQLLNYLSFIAVMFNGVHLTNTKNFKEAQDCYELLLAQMKDAAFHNRSLTDIYLATKFFSAQNMHKWGNSLLTKKNDEAMRLFDQAAKSFFLQAEEMDRLHYPGKEKIENSLLYAIHLLMKEGKFKEASEKLESMKKDFDKNNIYLYFLYKGLMQNNHETAIKYFNTAIKNPHNAALVNEKIAGYFFARGLFQQSITYFKERFKVTQRQVYSPELLEEDSHKKLSQAYLEESNLLYGLKEKIVANLSHTKNEQQSE